jgi:hypothetical protein
MITRDQAGEAEMLDNGLSKGTSCSIPSIVQ